MSFLKLNVLSTFFIFTIYGCPNGGEYRFRCKSYDYCDKTLGLVCGDGNCGQSVCPNGTIQFKSTCHLFKHSLVNQSTAKSFCANRGGKLVKILDQEKRSWLRTIVPTLFPISAYPWRQTFWVDAFSTTVFQFQWSNNDTLAKNSTFWCNGEPNNYGYYQSGSIIEACVSVFNATALCLADDLCNLASHNTICEFELLPCSPTATCQCQSDSYWDGTQCVYQNLP